MAKILFIIGSLRAKSFNRQLVDALLKSIAVS